MPTHVHIGGIQFITNGFIILLWLFTFRAIQTKFPNSAVGKGLAYIH